MPPIAPESTSTETAAAFKAALQSLGETQSSFTERLWMLGDHRTDTSILRSVQRMASGEIRVSGEMMVILELLKREREAGLKDWNRRVVWTEGERGTVRAQVDDFSIILSPERGEKWRVIVNHKDGYSHPWPRFQTSLEEAKIKAYGCHRDAVEYMEHIRKEAA